MIATIRFNKLSTSRFLYKHLKIKIYNITNLITCSYMKKKLSRGMLGPKMEEVKEVWRKLHNKQLSLYTLH
jgi:hypothetical protein